MESLGIISKVDTPTPWCAGIVVVLKKDKTVRRCVDLKPLNMSVLQEIHPLPKVDDSSKGRPMYILANIIAKSAKRAEQIATGQARHHLTVCDRLLLYVSRIVVPKHLQHDTLYKIHKGHQGIE